MLFPCFGAWFSPAGRQKAGGEFGAGRSPWGFFCWTGPASELGLTNWRSYPRWSECFFAPSPSNNGSKNGQVFWRLCARAPKRVLKCKWISLSKTQWDITWRATGSLVDVIVFRLLEFGQKNHFANSNCVFLKKCTQKAKWSKLHATNHRTHEKALFEKQTISYSKSFLFKFSPKNNQNVKQNRKPKTTASKNVRQQEPNKPCGTEKSNRLISGETNANLNKHNFQAETPLQISLI